MGKVLIVAGALVLAAGLVLSYAPWAVSWFGSLPGDIKIKRDHSFVLIPLSSMLLVSIAVSIIVNLFFRR